MHSTVLTASLVCSTSVRCRLTNSTLEKRGVQAILILRCLRFPRLVAGGARHNVTAMTEYRRRNVMALPGLTADGGGRGAQVSTPHMRAGPDGR